MPVALLFLIDITLIVLGFGVFAFFYTAVPHTYAEVLPPARVIHGARTIVVTRATTTPTAGPGADVARAANIGLAQAAQPGQDAPARAALEPARSAMGPREQELRSRTTATATPSLMAMSPTTATPRLPAPTAVSAIAEAGEQATAGPATDGPTVENGRELGGGKFSDKFTSGEIERTAISYRSANVNVTLTRVQREGVTYYVQDIYVRYIDNLRTAFAQNKYGRWISAPLLDIANQNAAIGAINGDWYGAGSIGVVIRNGVLYSDRVDGDVAVLYRDGTMRTFGHAEFDAQQAMADGAYHAWSFGPSLLDPEGQALTSFQTGISGRHPRTAIGYYEPGHYAFVVVDGRQPGYSNGMTLPQLSALFAEMGCKAAYNLDGGQSSVMAFGGQVVNRPVRGGRTTSDIIFVGE